MRAVAVDLDAVLGDTGPLFRAWLDDASRRARVEVGPADLERLGNWRPLLERYAEEHAPVHLRPRGEANAALRRLQAAGVRVGAFTPSPEPLARVALAQLGIARHVDVLECGEGARERLLAALGGDPSTVSTVAELVEAAG